MSSARSPTPPPHEPAAPRRPGPTARPRLAPGAQLVEVSGVTHLRLGTGDFVRLNEQAAGLLARCDGKQSMDALALRGANRDDTLAFLAVALELHWLVTD